VQTKEHSQAARIAFQIKIIYVAILSLTPLLLGMLIQNMKKSREINCAPKQYFQFSHLSLVCVFCSLVSRTICFCRCLNEPCIKWRQTYIHAIQRPVQRTHVNNNRGINCAPNRESPLRFCGRRQFSMWCIQKTTKGINWASAKVHLSFKLCKSII